MQAALMPSYYFEVSQEPEIGYHGVVNPGEPSAVPLRKESRFVTTQWDVILSASEEGAAQTAALEQLCNAYWYPIYAYIRRRGHNPEDAQDLTQEFLARLLGKQWLADIEPTGGRFRSFLLKAVNGFLANQFDRAQAARRGGGKSVISLDAQRAEQRYSNEPVTNETPETIFERRWAATVMDHALTRLREEAGGAGKARQFAVLHPFISREAAPGEYPAAAEQSGMTAGAIAVSVHRLRARYRELVRQEISGTLTDPAEVEEEMRHLYDILRG